MGELRDRMERDLVVRGLTENTCRAYLAAVKGLAAYYRRPPDQLSDTEVRQYQLHLIRERKLAWNSCRVAVFGLRFFYRVTLGRPWDAMQIPLPKGDRKRPAILGLHRRVREPRPAHDDTSSRIVCRPRLHPPGGLEDTEIRPTLCAPGCEDPLEPV